jgi:hypothetical protein
MIRILSIVFAVAGVLTAPVVAQAPATGPQAAKPQSEAAPSATASPAIPLTLMFSIDEINDIQSRAASVQADGSAERGNNNAIENASLFLSTILYSGPQDWTIWINGKPIGPQQDFEEFSVTDIGPRFVELLVPLSAQGMRPVRLEPNQTFLTRSGTVVEGAWNQ